MQITLHRSRIFSYFLISFIVGIFISGFMLFEFRWLAVLSSVFGITSGGGLVFRKKLLFVVAGIFFFLFLGMIRYQLSMPSHDSHKLHFYNGQQVSFRAVVSKPADVRTGYTKLTLSAVDFANGQKVNGQALVNVPLYPSYDYGDVLSVTCTLTEPEVFDDFNYKNYLAKDGIYSLCKQARVKFLVHGHGDWLYRWVTDLKNYLVAVINRVMPEPEASIFAATFLNVRRGIPEDVQEDFNRTGTTHIVAISGMHITLLVAMMMRVTQSLYIRREYAFWLITGLLIFYMIIIGAPASAVRAVIMGWIYLVAQLLGRLNRSGNSILCAAAIMIAVNPMILRDDIGFQLSFLAVIGLIYGSDYFTPLVSRVPTWGGLRENLQMTLAAQMTTLPLIIYNFGRISLIAPIVNFFVLPLTLPLMIVGFLGLLMSAIIPAIAFYILLPSTIGLKIMVFIIHIFAAIPGAAVDL